MAKGESSHENDRELKMVKSGETKPDEAAGASVREMPRRAFSGHETSGPSAADLPTMVPEDLLVAPERWKMPFWARYRLLSVAALILSAAWLVVSYTYIDQQFGWDTFSQVFPHEIGGLAAGIVTPLALLWLVVSYLERGRLLQQEAAALKWYLEKMVYPASGSVERVNEITEALRQQARDLTNASEDAARRAVSIDSMIRQRADELARITEEANIKSREASEVLRRQAEDLVQVSDRAISRAREAGMCCTISRTT